MRLFACVAPAFVCAVMGAVPAAAFVASNSLIVEPQGEGFNVPYRGESGARAFWCAAGEYAESVLNQPPETIVYRTSEPPRRSGDGIAFSLSPNAAARRTGLAILGAQGGGISIAHARSLCDAALFITE